MLALALGYIAGTAIEGRVPRLTIAPSLGSCVAALSLRQYVGRSVASRPPNPVQALRSLRSLQPGVLFSQGCGLLIGFLSLVCLVCGAAVLPWCCGAVAFCCGGGQGVNNSTSSER